MPGFDDQYHFSLLPFWGDFCLADFMLAAVGAGFGTEVTVILDETSKPAQIALGARWKRVATRVHVLERGISELAAMVNASTADRVILAGLSSLCLVAPGAFAGRAAECGDQLLKLSVGRTPIEVFCSSRVQLAKILSRAGERAAGRPPLRESLFQGILHDSIDLIEDVPGEILFQNDLMEYYRNNMWLVGNCESPRYHAAVSHLPDLASRGSESRITERGCIRNSWIGSGVEVDGTVEDSIIFPNVVIRRGALVSKSVVTNGNRIGSGTEIHRTLVLPFTAEVPRPVPNIGDNCSIGAKTSTMKNTDFPAQIQDGVTVLGTSAEIPNGFRAEAASYIAPGVAVSHLRKLKLLKRGASVLDDRTAAAGDSK